jgi:hypothetical protein
VEEVLAVVAGAVVVGIHRRQAAFASDVVGASAPAMEDDPFAPEDMNDDYRRAIRSHPSTALAGCRC